MLKSDKILITNTTTFIGNSIEQKLKKEHYNNIISNEKLDYFNQTELKNYLNKEKPQIIFIISNNYVIQNNIISNSKEFTKKIYCFNNNNINSNIPIINYNISNVWGGEDSYDFNLDDPNSYNHNLKQNHIIPYLIRHIWEAKIFKLPHIYLNYPCYYLYHITIDDLLNNILKSKDIYITSNYNICFKNSIPFIISIIKNIIDYDGDIIFTSDLENKLDIINTNEELISNKFRYHINNLKINNKYFILN
jgi:hypothetical protein